MKTMKNLLKFMSILVLTLFIISCEGEDGPAGPAGLQGEQGPQGDQGPQGEPGTANVIYSDWITRDFENEAASETNEQLLTSFTAGEFNLAEDIVLVFGRREVNAIVSEVRQLPFILAGQSEYYGFEVASFSGGSSLRVEVSTLDGGTNLFTFFDEFRYVIIPGGQAAGKSTQDLQKMSYEEVTELFNIK